MIVTATKFQQNVGYYLRLVEEGESVKIQKLKPRKSLYILSKDKTKNESAKVDKKAKLKKEIEKLNLKFTDRFNDGVKFQRWVRS